VPAAARPSSEHSAIATPASAVRLSGDPLTAEQVEAIAHGAAVELDGGALERVDEAHRALAALIDAGTEIYGVTTGLGALVSTGVRPERAADLQLNLLRSHAAGAGDPLPRDAVRAALAVRINGLLKAASGIRREPLQVIADLLNSDILPLVPRTGSLGASGDLAPSAHAFLVLVGEGVAQAADGETLDGATALARCGHAPLRLAPKEGLALTNGTHFMSGIGALAVAASGRLIEAADRIAATTIEALGGVTAAFDADLNALRPLVGQQRSAAILREALEGSMRATTDDSGALQDAYSLRCVPQVHGATRDVITHARRVVEIELGSVTDNPVVLADHEEVASTGNFHGQPLAFAADFCAIALADLASISERRTDRLMDPARSQGLPAFLAVEAGINSGFMLAHYTAAAAVNRLRTHATPTSIDSISTSGGQEDHVSMGWNGCRKLRTSIDDVARVLAIEILCAAQALELRREGAGGFGPGIGHPEAGLRPSPETEAVIARLRAEVPALPSDRFLAPDLAAAERLVRSGALLPEWME